MTAALVGVSGQQYPPAALYSLERTGTHSTGGWVGPRAGLDGRKFLSPNGIRSRTVQPVFSCYTDWATRPTFVEHVVLRIKQKYKYIFRSEIYLLSKKQGNNRVTEKSTNSLSGTYFRMVDLLNMGCTICGSCMFGTMLIYRHSMWRVDWHVWVMWNDMWLA